jgi:proline racemase
MQLTNLLHAVDAHAEGELSRVVVGGLPNVAGASMAEKRQTLLATTSCGAISWANRLATSPCTADIAWGGAFFALVDAAAVGLRIVPEDAAELVALGRRITEAAAQRFPVAHIHESIIGSTFTGRIEGLTTVGDSDAVRPSITGRAWITGTHQVGRHPGDALGRGFGLGDTWFGAERRWPHPGSA